MFLPGPNCTKTSAKTWWIPTQQLLKISHNPKQPEQTSTFTHQPTHLSLYPGVHGLEKDPEAEATRLNHGTPAEAREPAPEPLPELEMKPGSKDYEIAC